MDKQHTRRGFLGFAGKIAAGIAAGTIMPAAIRKAFASEAPWYIPGPYYIQLGAYQNLEYALIAREKLPWKNVKIHDSEAVLNGTPTKVYKLILNEYTVMKDVAMEKLRTSATFVYDAGVIQFEPDGNIIWVPTAEERIEQLVKEAIPEAKSVQRDPKKSAPPVRPSLPPKPVPTPKPMQPTAFDHFINEAIDRYPFNWDHKETLAIIRAVIQIESGRDPNAINKKSKDYGLMQLHHSGGWSTWRVFHAGKYKSSFFHGKQSKSHKCDIMDVEQNIDAGVHYLSYLNKKFPNAPLRIILRMYNAGENLGVDNDAYGDKAIEQVEQERISILNHK